MSLAEKKCVPCHGGVAKLTAPEFAPLLAELRGWQVENDLKLIKKYQFPDFALAMLLANKVAALAEDEQHHPDLHIKWGELIIELWTHAIGGLSENDFVLAAKIDRIEG